MTTVVVILLVALLLIAALRLWSTANRLDRLHVRTEAAWVALVGALSRRIVATRAAAAAGALAPADAEELRRLTTVADAADRAHRADAENDLSRALAQLPPMTEADLVAEIIDAVERIGLARRFYNDAVRDTRALRAVRFTRVFRLAGRAALPDYFEIADSQPVMPQVRTSARVVLFRERAERPPGAETTYEVLLFRFTEPGGPDIWFTPGGGMEPGEDLTTAALRELSEETSLVLQADQLAGPLWNRHARFVAAGIGYDQKEVYFSALAPSEFHVDTSGFTTLEQATLTDWRWWTVEAMTDPAIRIYPIELVQRLGDALDAARTSLRGQQVVEIT